MRETTSPRERWVDHVVATTQQHDASSSGERGGDQGPPSHQSDPLRRRWCVHSASPLPHRNPTPQRQNPSPNWSHSSLKRLTPQTCSSSSSRTWPASISSLGRTSSRYSTAFCDVRSALVYPPSNTSVHDTRRSSLRRLLDTRMKRRRSTRA